MTAAKPEHETLRWYKNQCSTGWAEGLSYSLVDRVLAYKLKCLEFKLKCNHPPYVLSYLPEPIFMHFFPIGHACAPDLPNGSLYTSSFKTGTIFNTLAYCIAFKNQSLSLCFIFETLFVKLLIKWKHDVPYYQILHDCNHTASEENKTFKIECRLSK